MSDIHIMGLPLSITNRIRCKGAPSSTRMLFSSRGFPEQGMGFFHRIPTFNKRIEFASIASPSPNENGFAPKGSTSPSEWDSHRDGHPLSPENRPLQTYGILVRRIIPSLANGFRFYRRDWVSTEALFRGHASHGIPFHKGFRLCI